MGRLLPHRLQSAASSFSSTFRRPHTDATSHEEPVSASHTELVQSNADAAVDPEFKLPSYTSLAVIFGVGTLGQVRFYF